VNGVYDIEFMDNEKGQWKAKRAWHGILVENVVQGIARDLLAAAIVRAETRGWQVVHHAHDELVIEAPTGAILPQDVLALLLEAPPWAAGLPLSGKVRTGMLLHTHLDEYTYLDAQGDRFKINTRDVAETRPATKSIMPDGLVDLLTDQEVRDLLAYLVSRR